LEKTELSINQLEEHFSDKKNRIEAFRQADEFGKLMFEITKLAADQTGTLRYLVI
jgi:hypothetical protein